MPVTVGCVVLGAFTGYVVTSLALLKFPWILRSRKRTTIKACHISHRGGIILWCFRIFIYFLNSCVCVNVIISTFTCLQVLLHEENVRTRHISLKKYYFVTFSYCAPHVHIYMPALDNLCSLCAVLKKPSGTFVPSCLRTVRVLVHVPICPSWNLFVCH